jgi:hypothetical protein
VRKWGGLDGLALSHHAYILLQLASSNSFADCMALTLDNRILFCHWVRTKAINRKPFICRIGESLFPALVEQCLRNSFCVFPGFGIVAQFIQDSN